MKNPIQSVALRRFPVPAEQVFDAWLDVALISRWMFGPAVRDERIERLALEPKVGGKFSFVVNRQGTEVDHIGDYLEIERPGLLVFRWATRGSLPDTSRVIVEIMPRDQSCDVSLTQVMSSDRDPFAHKDAPSWPKRLTALEQVFAPGHD